MVASHQRTISDKEMLKKMSAKASSAVDNKAVSATIIDKYQNQPMNLKVMLDMSWGSQKVKKWRTEDGKRVAYMDTVRRANLNNQDWGKILKQNGGLVNVIINKKNLNSEIREDLKQEAHRAIFDAVNGYEGKYNPKNPADLSKHIASYIGGYVDAEIARQSATRIDLPYQQRVVYSKFKQLFDLYDGDYTKMHDHLKLKKKDLYPSITQGADDLLPQEGYVTIRKKDTLKKKTEQYNDKINVINDDFNGQLNNLSFREKSDESKEDYNSNIEQFQSKIAAEKDKTKIAEMKSGLESYRESFAPLDKEEFDKMTSLVENKRQNKLREARDWYDKETDKTVISGTTELFGRFESIMGLSFVNTSDTYGEGVNQKPLEEIFESTETADPQTEMTVKFDFKNAMNKLERAIDMLNPATAEIVKLRLGLSAKSKLYPHALWGEPMPLFDKVNPTESVSGNLPKDLFIKVSALDYKKKEDNWNKNKPTSTVRERKPDAVFKKETKAFDKRKTESKARISRNLTTHFKNSTRIEKDQMRDNVRAEMKVRLQDAPKMYKDVKLNKTKFAEATKKWESNKPTKDYNYNTLRNLVSKEYELGKRVLQRMISTDDADNIIQSYRAMRRYGLKKADLTGQIRKSIMFDEFFGIEYGREDIHIAKGIFTKLKEAIGM